MTTRSFFEAHQSLIIVVGLLATVLGTHAMLYFHTRRLKPARKRLGFRESLERGARSLSYGALYSQFVLGTVFFLCGAAALVTSFGEPALAVIGLLVGAYMLTIWSLVVHTQGRLRHGEGVNQPAPGATLTAPPRSGKRAAL